jgi:hypothetical protein
MRPSSQSFRHQPLPVAHFLPFVNKQAIRQLPNNFQRGPSQYEQPGSSTGETGFDPLHGTTLPKTSLPFASHLTASYAAPGVQSAPPGSLGDRASAGTSSRQALASWISRAKSLTADQRRAFSEHGRPTFEQYVAEFTRIAQAKSKSSKARKAAEFAKPLFEIAQVLAPIAAYPWISSIDPTHSTLVLGGVAFVLSFGVKFVDSADKIVESLSTSFEKLLVVKEFVALYPTHAGVQDEAMLVCEDILDFCIEASKDFLDGRGRPRSSSRLFVASITTSFDSKFAPLQRKLDSHRQDFETCTSYALHQAMGIVLKTQDIARAKDHDRSLGEYAATRNMGTNSLTAVNRTTPSINNPTSTSGHL